MSYRIYRGGSLIGTSATTTYTDSGLSPSTGYNYTVSAVNAQGVEGPQSESVTGTTTSGTAALFFDDFNYTVARTDNYATKTALFVNAGYRGMRDSSDGLTGTYIYTTASIEGDSSGIPGGGRALALESLGATYNTQTDYYLSFPADNWPAELWLQFWIYVQVDATSGKMSNIVGTHTKFGYPLLGGDPSYPLETVLTAWINSLSGTAMSVDHAAILNPPTQGAYSFYIKPQYDGTNDRAQIVNRIGTGDQNILHPNLRGDNPNDVFLLPNQWNLVKLHIKHNGAVNSNTSEWHYWARSKGQHIAGFTKYSEYIGGQSNPCGAFNFWNRLTDSAPITGYLFPSTANSPTGPFGNTWIYMKDYAVAATEGDLPTYGSY